MFLGSDDGLSTALDFAERLDVDPRGSLEALEIHMPGFTTTAMAHLLRLGDIRLRRLRLSAPLLGSDDDAESKLRISIQPWAVLTLVFDRDPTPDDQLPGVVRDVLSNRGLRKLVLAGSHVAAAVDFVRRLGTTTFDLDVLEIRVEMLPVATLVALLDRCQRRITAINVPVQLDTTSPTPIPSRLRFPELEQVMLCNDTDSRILDMLGGCRMGDTGSLLVVCPHRLDFRWLANVQSENVYLFLGSACVVSPDIPMDDTKGIRQLHMDARFVNAFSRDKFDYLLHGRANADIHFDQTTAWDPVACVQHERAVPWQLSTHTHNHTPPRRDSGDTHVQRG